MYGSRLGPGTHRSEFRPSLAAPSEEGNLTPMLDAYIPEGSRTPQAERKLLGTYTDLLLEHEAVDPANKAAWALAWFLAHRHEMYVPGAPAKAPQYRFTCQGPERQYDQERGTAVTKAMTEVEGSRWPSPQGRDRRTGHWEHRRGRHPITVLLEAARGVTNA
jgi:hypothetical protein